jgi:hypothetical protein
LDTRLTKRQQLGILYLLSKIELLQGNFESAAKKLKMVAKFGNKLWIAEDARQLLHGQELAAYQ